MSQPSRAERRRQERGGAAPPPRRDPMRSDLYRRRHRARRVGPRLRRLQLVAEAAGRAGVCDADPGTQREREADSADDRRIAGRRSISKRRFPIRPQGGHGQTVDGVGCGTQEYATLHMHTHLSIYNNGKLIQVPRLHRFCAQPRHRRLPLLDSHARCERHDSPRSARSRAAARRTVYAGHALRHLGTAAAAAMTSRASRER